MSRIEEVGTLSLVVVCIATLLYLGYSVGYDEGRHEIPMALEPRCELTYVQGKLYRTVCPDSLGRMPKEVR